MRPNKPLIVEFLGTPEAGKSTTICETKKRFEKICKTLYVQEAAEQRPECIPKGGLDGHWWIRLKGVNDIIEASYSNNDLVLLDRGIIDSLFWNELFLDKSKLNTEEKRIADAFFELVGKLPDVCFVFKVSPEECIRRRGGEGSIVTYDFVRRYNELLDKFKVRYPETVVYMIDTTDMSKEYVANFVETKIRKHIK